MPAGFASGVGVAGGSALEALWRRDAAVGGCGGAGHGGVWVGRPIEGIVGELFHVGGEAEDGGGGGVLGWVGDGGKGEVEIGEVVVAGEAAGEDVGGAELRGLPLEGFVVAKVIERDAGGAHALLELCAREDGGGAEAGLQGVGEGVGELLAQDVPLVAAIGEVGDEDFWRGGVMLFVGGGEVWEVGGETVGEGGDGGLEVVGGRKSLGECGTGAGEDYGD